MALVRISDGAKLYLDLRFTIYDFGFLILIFEEALKQNLILDLSFAFAVKIVNLYKYLSSEKKEYVLSKQLLRSGTSIGANVKEAVVAQSRKDFIAKLNISLKEANETEYWLQLLRTTGYLDESSDILDENRSLIRVLTSIIKSTNNNNSTR